MNGRVARTCRWAAAFLVLLASPASAAGRDTDSRPLTHAERATFLPLVCRSPRIDERGATRCATLVGFDNQGRPATDIPIALSAVVYGAFSHAGADEAYVTYESWFEPHAKNFGGGIMFARNGGTWRLRKWYRGWKMDRCVAMPDRRAQLFCLNRYSGQGDIESYVVVQALPPVDSRDILEDKAVLRATDARGMRLETMSGCFRSVPEGRALLLSIDTLKRSTHPGAFAQSAATYETSSDIADACSRGRNRTVRQTHGTVYFRALADGTVVADVPAHFTKGDP